MAQRKIKFSLAAVDYATIERVKQDPSPATTAALATLAESIQRTSSVALNLSTKWNVTEVRQELLSRLEELDKIAEDINERDRKLRKRPQDKEAARRYRLRQKENILLTPDGEI